MSESTETSSAGRATVDGKRCEAMGFCVQIAPALFELTDGRPPARVVDRVLGDDERELAFEAEQMCPTQAIEVHDGVS